MIGPGVEREPLSAVDAAWLRMDSPQSPMVIAAALEFDGPMDREALAGVLAERLVGRRRFRQRVAMERVTPWPRWEIDPRFDLRAHLHHVALPAPGGHAALAALASDLVSTPLDYSKPLWQVHLVDGAAGGSAVVVRLHHCIADGVSLVRLLLDLADGAGGEGVPREVGQLRDARLDRRDRLARLRRLVAEARSAAHLIALPRDARTPLSGEQGTRKRVAWSNPIAFDELVAAAREAGGTVNDVLLSALAGALRHHLESLHAWHEGLEVRAVEPVNLRPGEGAADQLGNRFGLVYVPLPLGIAEPRRRLREVRRRTDALKRSEDASASLGLVGALGLVTAGAERLGVDWFSRKATLLATNVAGPPAPISIAGRPLRRLVVWAPMSGEIALAFSFLSYAGTITVALRCDEGVVPDPDAMVRDVEAEIAVLR